VKPIATRCRQPRALRVSSLAARRGFTLVELMVVVIIISVLAVIAIPAITYQMRDRRTAEAAERIATLYRNARLRAMGRGSAVLVSFDLTNERVDVREAIRGGSGNACARLPMSSCTMTNWAATGAAAQSQLLETLDLPQRAEYSGIALSGATQLLEVCFTPMGRPVQRTVAGSTFAGMTGVPVISVTRSSGGQIAGLVRRVALLPNGLARLSTAEHVL
jgi:prepilin-type N-terminal cleavage/methylation domain-containing protein